MAGFAVTTEAIRLPMLNSVNERCCRVGHVAERCEILDLALCVRSNISDMNIREVKQAFTAMDAYGHPRTVPKCAMLSSFGDGSGFSGRIDDIASVASFVYFGVVYYA